MSVKGSRAALTKTTRDLINEWHTTKNYWRDAKRQAFEAAYLATLADRVNAAVRTIEDIDKILDKIRRDCE